MNATSGSKDFARTFNLPYQLGIFLAANAVKDSCAVMDGLNCVMSKIDFLAGNHDAYSTLLSPDGAHRIICTMAGPLPQKENPEKPLAALLNSVAGSGRFSVVMVTGLPYLKLAGLDYEGLAAGVTGGAPVVDVPPSSLDADWLEGYALALNALARALPPRKAAPRPRSVALAGYFPDRGEGDHAANIKELRMLLKLCGLELTCVFPSGGSFRDLSRALEAGLIVSLPYGRRAAATLAKKSGAKLVETGLPLGLRGTAAWLETVRRAAGLKG
ncbi:MAG TPA: nitrogenase component 1, partial [Elusimicrobiales bacterium]|nr:nitrogenase component 1 [Elusimicrobiales bacterium]